MTARGQAIRRRRETLGLTREELAGETRIPVEHIQSLEDGATGALPAGPYAEAWLRSLEAHLGLEPPASADAAGAAPAGPTPLWLARVVAGVAMGALIAAITWQFVEGYAAQKAAAPVVVEGQDQEVLVRALKNTTLTVLADGELIREGPMAGGDELEIRAEDRIELRVLEAKALRIDFNGERIVPQGRQEEPRVLVFVDDGGGR